MPKKILFVDDNPDQIKYFRRYLDSQNDFKTEIMVKISELFKMISKGNLADLIVLDIMMPTEGRYESDPAQGGIMTGVKVYEELQDKQINIPVMIYSVLRKEDVPMLDANVPYHWKNDDFEEIEYTIRKLLKV